MQGNCLVSHNQGSSFHTLRHKLFLHLETSRFMTIYFKKICGLGVGLVRVTVGVGVGVS